MSTEEALLQQQECEEASHKVTPTTPTKPFTPRLTETSIDGKALIIQGVVDQIKPLASKFGFSWRIIVGGVTYYFNSKYEITCGKMFEEGKGTAFTIIEKNSWKVINTVFYTF